MTILTPDLSPSSPRGDAPHFSGRRSLAYAAAAAGPIVAAGAQFLLSLQLVHALATAEFGRFALLLLISQLSLGLGAALISAPYPMLIRRSATPGDVEKVLQTANLAVALFFTLLLGLVATASGTDAGPALLFSAYGGVMLLRAFARAQAYFRQSQMAVLASDLCYGGVLVAVVAANVALGTGAVEYAYAGLLGSATLAMLPFGPTYLRSMFAGMSLARLSEYRTVLRQHSSWSLLGVVTTEATANAHAYLVTFLAGPAAFAPLAASALLIRPVALAMNALTDFERPQLARQLAAGQPWPQVRHGLSTFRQALVGTWAVSLAASALILTCVPTLLFPSRYDLSQISLGAILWMLIALLRTLRTPESVLLQASGEFRNLAVSSLLSSIVSIAAVLSILTTGEPVWSLAGIALGESAFLCGVWWQARHVRMARTDIP